MASTIDQDSVAFKVAITQEEGRLNVLHPAPSDIPGCIRLFDEYLSCNGESVPAL